MRMIYLILGILAIMFLFSGCTTFVDWQYYKYNKLSEICAGVYVYDKKLYDEVKYIGRKKFTLSNGYPIQWESISMNTKYSRIEVIGYSAFYVDKDEAKHIIYQLRGYQQKYFRLHFGGDEGRGFWFNAWDYHITTPLATGFPHHNVFYVDSNNEVECDG